MAARRPSLIKPKKQKTVRVTRSEQYIVNRKYLGDEPELKPGYGTSDFIRALNWYNSMVTAQEAREYICTYLKSKNRISELKTFNKVADNNIPTTAAWIARLMSRDTEVSLKDIQFFETKFADCLKKAVVEVPDAVPTGTGKVISIQQRVKDKASDIIGDIEAMLDLGEAFSMYDWLKSNEIPSTYSQHIIHHYAPWLQELIEVRTEPDAQLKEAYRNYTKKQLDARIQLINGILEDCERYADTKKKTKVPRKPRTVSVEKKLKNFKYQKEFNEFKIASVNPEKLIDSQELWTYNTKYKTLTVFRALDRGGLQVKGTAIIGYDESTSMSKRTGHKAEEHVKRVLNSGKLQLRKVTDGLKDAAFTNRITEHVILLRVTTG